MTEFLKLYDQDLFLGFFSRSVLMKYINYRM